MAYQDEIAAANRLKTMEERFAARNAVRAKYGMAPEKSTRGGLAGIYDRNKGFLTTAASMAAGALGGPAAASALGALIKGVDRPGKRGIGFDFGQAARGAAEGYVAGAAGAGLKGGLGSGTVKQSLGKYFGLPSAGAAQPAPAGLPSAAKPFEMMTDAEKMAYFSGGSAPAAAPAAQPSVAASLLGFAQKNPAVVQGIAGGAADVIGSAQERAVQERRLQLEEQAMRTENERKARLAELLMPMFQYEASRAGGSR